MKSPLNILYLEDDDSDAALIQATLKADAIDCSINRVQNRTSFVEALDRGSVDLILSDFVLPDFDGSAALAIAKAQLPDTPLIFVSEMLGEERAVESLKHGATDYVLKDHLARLAPAVRRAMDEADHRQEARRLEIHFIEAQKSEVVAHMASSVAHDINILLGVIMLSSDMMLDSLGSSHPISKFGEEIQYACKQAGALTKQLLTFEKKEPSVPIILDLDDAVRDALPMLRRISGQSIPITFTPGPTVGGVRADAGHFGQVMMNLVVNARDAMPDGGQITLTTRNVSFTSEAQDQDGLVGDYVVFTVADTGTGISPDVLENIFKPFYTTKAVGKGTGLGLATCKTIVDQAGGVVRVESEVGKGTAFQVYLPVVAQAVADPRNNLAAPVLPGGSETILLVEDDHLVRKLAGSFLSNYGYHVLSAADGQEGLNLALAHQGDTIDLVVTDVIMPQMGGRIMADWLQAHYPGLKILFTSGYIDNTLSKHGILDPDVEFLPKPYSSSTLLKKVREVLDGKQPTALFN